MIYCRGIQVGPFEKGITQYIIQVDGKYPDHYHFLVAPLWISASLALQRNDLIVQIVYPFIPVANLRLQ